MFSKILAPVVLKGRCRGFHFTAANRFARILATDEVDECCVDIFRKRGHQVDLLKTMPEPELMKAIGQYDGLVVRSATKVTGKVLGIATNLKIVGRAGVGVDNIDIAQATKHGVMVMNTPGGNTVSTAQLAMSLLCSMARNIPAADMSVKAGLWDRKSFVGVELQGKTLGVVGCGRIGQVVISCAQTLGMKTIGYDPVMSAEDFGAIPGVKRVELEEIWKQSDFITVHTPLTPQTTNLIGEATLAKCKKGVRIVNCARGGIVDEAALLKALESGQVAGAALDVFTSEPPKEGLKPLIAHPRLIGTPHLGASTDEAQINVARDIANQMCDVFEQKDFVGIVNVPYLSASTNPHMKPFMSLAETIGMIQAQLSPSSAAISKVTLKTFGGRDVNITNKAARQLLEAHVHKGIVKRSPSTAALPSVDMISAPLIAKEQLKISTHISDQNPTQQFLSSSRSSSTSNPYWNLVCVDVVREDGSECSVTGVVLGSSPHIVQVDQFMDVFAFKPEGNYILAFRNEDRPGAIKEVLVHLAESNVNIASMNVARAATSDDLALCFMALDDDVPAATMEALRGLPFLHNVAKIQL